MANMTSKDKREAVDGIKQTIRAELDYARKILGPSKFPAFVEEIEQIIEAFKEEM